MDLFWIAVFQVQKLLKSVIQFVHKIKIGNANKIAWLMQTHGIYVI